MPKINREEYETLKELDDKWKWIATDRDDYVWGYENRPKKLEDTQLWHDLKTSCYAFLGTELFQFIQWEDEEPYNIQELIEEYESSPSNHLWTPNPIDFESEETEVKKDKKWLKDSVTKEMQDLFSTTNPTYFDFEYINKKLRGLVDQLDEPEAYSQVDKLADFIMSEVEGEPSQSESAVDTAIRIIQSYQNQETLSQDWINKHSYAVAYDGMLDDIKIVYVDDLQNLLVPEQKELEVKIQELIEGYEKEDGRHSNPENAWIREFITGLESLIENKEREPKYYVDLDTAAFVAKWVRDGSVQIYTDSISGNHDYELHLTEQEIKDYDPRFWPFAVIVEELK